MTRNSWFHAPYLQHIGNPLVYNEACRCVGCAAARAKAARIVAILEREHARRLLWRVADTLARSDAYMDSLLTIQLHDSDCERIAALFPQPAEGGRHGPR